MEKSTVIGLVLAFFAVGSGMVLKGTSLTVLWNPAAIMIILVGTVAAVLNAFPMDELKKVPKLIKIIFKEPQITPKKEIVHNFVALATTARREGLLSLENHLESIEDPFIRNGMQLVIDGGDAEYVQTLLEEEIYATEERHKAGALIFTQAGTYAPTLGVLGAVVGLIGALGNLSDIEKLGYSIAAAFVATLLGIFTGYVLWHPIANKLKRISRKEIETKQMIVEGVLAIQAGNSPMAIEQLLLVYLPASERRTEREERNAQDQEAQGAA